MKDGDQERAKLAQQRNGMNTTVGFTKLELPKVDTFETAVTFEPDCDPLRAHEALVTVFGQPAGNGRYLFCADSSVPGRYWVRSAAPWSAPPASAVSALAPKRVVIQLAPGLMYHFSLAACAGEVTLVDGRKHIKPFQRAEQWEQWFNDSGADFGIRPLMVSVSQRTMRFTHDGAAFRVEYGVLEGALEVADAERLMRRILRGIGSHRRLGLGMLKLQS